MPDKTVKKQYRAHLESVAPKPFIAELIGDDLEVMKDKVRVLLGGSPAFEAAQSTVGTPGLTLIYHPQFNGGEVALGWISAFEVPEHMTVKSNLDRLREAAA